MSKYARAFFVAMPNWKLPTNFKTMSSFLRLFGISYNFKLFYFFENMEHRGVYNFALPHRAIFKIYKTHPVKNIKNFVISIKVLVLDQFSCQLNFEILRFQSSLIFKFLLSSPLLFLSALSLHILLENIVFLEFSIFLIF